MWRSRRYHMSPMPYSIFFRGGYAIHGTYETRHLGARASHGCIRLSPGHAAALFSLVRGAGLGRTRISITG
jgi:lipoprotein-anchoring transpeptidase ErfK/SrfK